MDNVPDQIIVGNGGALLHAQDQEPVYQNVEFNYPNSRNYLAHEVRNFFRLWLCNIRFRRSQIYFL